MPHFIRDVKPPNLVPNATLSLLVGYRGLQQFFYFIFYFIQDNEGDYYGVCDKLRRLFFFFSLFLYIFFSHYLNKTGLKLPSSNLLYDD